MKREPQSTTTAVPLAAATLGATLRRVSPVVVFTAIVAWPSLWGAQWLAHALGAIAEGPGSRRIRPDRPDVDTLRESVDVAVALVAVAVAWWCVITAAFRLGRSRNGLRLVLVAPPDAHSPGSSGA